ncbi:hypothetical protein MTR_8g005860 [Medicago truncatula]|uniref:Uncharacterized protein n=1 Tax=Medicago truncatula TaxID=3880 RepID=G7LAS0_MEDTR|nr:hypothetical protein MTR_8g005860 [Medicago truncatula]
MMTSCRVLSLKSAALRVRPTTTINHSPSPLLRQFSCFIITTNVYHQLGSVQSLLPLHSTVASCTMVSFLTIQGILNMFHSFPFLATILDP